MASEARFEAEVGWVAVSPDGSMWCHRGRGSAGVLVFERGPGGERLHHATHQDCFSVDTNLTTPSRRTAVRFALNGSPRRAPGAVLQRPASVEGRAAEPIAPDPTDVGTAPSQLHGPEPVGAVGDGGDAETKTGILEALPRLSAAERKEVLARLLQLEQ